MMACVEHHVARSSRAALAVAVSLGCHTASRAADPVATLPPVVVTATRLPASNLPVSQSVIVIPNSEVTERNAASVPDLLRGIAPLHVDQPGTPGGFSSLYLRGADPSHTVVLIDGVKVNDPTNPRGGGFDLSMLDPQLIDRIEILPGASSAMYGADAIAGVLNVITRRPEGSGVRARAGAGGGGYRSAFVAGSVTEGGIALQAEGGGLNDGHGSDTSFKRLRTAGVQARAGTERGRHIGLSLRLMDHESGAFPEDSGGPRFAVLRELELRETNSVIGAIDAGSRTSWGALRAYVNAFVQHADTRSPGVAPGVRDPFGIPRSLMAAHYRRYTAGATASFGSAAETPALIGAETQQESGDVASTLLFGPFGIPADFSLDRRTHSLFAEGQRSLSERFALQAGVRADDVQNHGTHVSWRGGARYLLGDASAHRLAFNIGTGFKPPSFFALAHPIVGNPGLVPEESRTSELSLSSNGPAKRFAYRASIFRSEYENLVDFDAGPPPRLVNRSEVEIDGVDLSLNGRVGARAQLGGGATWLDYDLPPGTGPLRNRPRFKATAHAIYAITGQWTARAAATWIGRTFDSSIPTGGMTVSPYLVADASLMYVVRNIRISFAVDNLFDREYGQFIGFPSRGRRARMEVAVSL